MVAEADPEAEQPAQDWQAAGERIQTLIDAASSGGTVARERAEELVRTVTDLYGAGLERILNIAYDHGSLSDEVLDDLTNDDLVTSLLLVHGLHPYDVHTRVERALDDVRPYLGSHGGDVELLGVSDDVVQLRLLGNCDGCPSSSVTLKLAVEGAIEAAAPEIVDIEVDESTSDSVISVESLRSRLDEVPADNSTWTSMPQIAELSSGEAASIQADGFQADGARVLACRIGEDYFAYLDRCANCENSMEGTVLERRMGAAVGEAVMRCPTCRFHYDVRRAGACVDDEALHLTPLPLLSRDGVPSVSIPELASLTGSRP